MIEIGHPLLIGLLLELERMGGGRCRGRRRSRSPGTGCGWLGGSGGSGHCEGRRRSPGGWNGRSVISSRSSSRSGVGKFDRGGSYRRCYDGGCHRIIGRRESGRGSGGGGRGRCCLCCLRFLFRGGRGCCHDRRGRRSGGRRRVVLLQSRGWNGWCRHHGRSCRRSSGHLLGRLWCCGGAGLGALVTTSTACILAGGDRCSSACWCCFRGDSIGRGRAALEAGSCHGGGRRGGGGGDRERVS